MEKREFLGSAVAGLMLGSATKAAAAVSPPKSRAARGPALLTVSGLIGAGNRGPLDPALDQMLSKQKVQFSKAQTFDFAAIMELPAITIKPTLEYDNKQHTLKGPMLVDVMKASGGSIGPKTAFFVRAVDGYVAQVTATDAMHYRYIVATHLDGQPMALGGLGPLWVVFDADRYPDFSSKPVNQRFGSCPWAAYHTEIKDS